MHQMNLVNLCHNNNDNKKKKKKKKIYNVHIVVNDESEAQAVTRWLDRVC